MVESKEQLETPDCPIAWLRGEKNGGALGLQPVVGLVVEGEWKMGVMMGREKSMGNGMGWRGQSEVKIGSPVAWKLTALGRPS